MSNYLLNVCLNILCITLVNFIGGLLVLKKDVKVNYTRKMDHFALLFLPLIIVYIFPYESPSPLFLLLTLFIILFSYIIYIKPIRERVSFIRVLFASFDRPEDRPHTLLWLWTQVICVYMILVPMIMYFTGINRYELLFIPILINGVGDGLAEPVGVRFGKHKYKAYALFSKQKHVRSLEGSACVLIVGIVSVLICFPFFTMQQFIIALISIPIIMTLAEAFSPHTWDNPFLLLICGIMLYVVLLF